MPVPTAGPDDALFWAACRRRELRIQLFRLRHLPPPAGAGLRRVPVAQDEWAPVPGTGTVFSYTIAANPTHPALRGGTMRKCGVRRTR